MFHLISANDRQFSCRVFDVKANRWHVFDFDPLACDHGITVSAADGGLLCDSRSREWTVVGSGEQSRSRMVGCRYKWDEGECLIYHGERLDPVVYEVYTQQQLQSPEDSDDLAPGQLVKTFVLLKERLFDPHKERRPGPVYFSDEDVLPHFHRIYEYCLAQDATRWVKVQTHVIQLCPFRRLSRRGSPFVSSCMRRFSDGVCAGRCYSAIL